MLMKFFFYIADAKTIQTPQTMGRRTALFLFVLQYNLETKFSGLVCMYREMYACVVFGTLARLSPFFFL
jgi:hypothetical protein